MGATMQAVGDGSPGRGHGATFLPHISSGPGNVQHSGAGGVSPLAARSKKLGGRLSASMPTIATGANLGGTEDHKEHVGGPGVLEELNFCHVSGPSKASSVGEPLTLGAEAAEAAELSRAARPGRLEDELSDEPRELTTKLRRTLLLYKPDKKLCLTLVRDLIEVLQEDLNHKSDLHEELRAKTQKEAEEAAEAMAHVAAQRDTLEAKADSQQRELLQAAMDKSELEHQVKALEEELTTANSIGMTAAEAAQTVTQLKKARATVESLKQQMQAMSDKVLKAEQEQRAQEAALHERRLQLEKTLSANIEKVQAAPASARAGAPARSPGLRAPAAGHPCPRAPRPARQRVSSSAPFSRSSAPSASRASRRSSRGPPKSSSWPRSRCLRSVDCSGSQLIPFAKDQIHGTRSRREEAPQGGVTGVERSGPPRERRRGRARRAPRSQRLRRAQIRTSRIAQRQQHTLVVEWRIKASPPRENSTQRLLDLSPEPPEGRLISQPARAAAPQRARCPPCMLATSALRAAAGPGFRRRTRRERVGHGGADADSLGAGRAHRAGSPAPRPLARGAERPFVRSSERPLVRSSRARCARWRRTPSRPRTSCSRLPPPPSY